MHMANKCNKCLKLQWTVVIIGSPLKFLHGQFSIDNSFNLHYSITQSGSIHAQIRRWMGTLGSIWIKETLKGKPKDPLTVWIWIWKVNKIQKEALGFVFIFYWKWIFPVQYLLNVISLVPSSPRFSLHLQPSKSIPYTSHENISGSLNSINYNKIKTKKQNKRSQRNSIRKRDKHWHTHICT